MKRNAPLGMSTCVVSRFPTLSALRALQDTGFAAVELLGDGSSRLDLADIEQVRKVAASVRRLRLPVSSIHSRLTPGDLSSPDEQERGLQMRFVGHALEAAERLQCPAVVVHPSLGFKAPVDRPSRYRILADALAQLSAEAERRGVRIAVENMLPDHLGDDLAEFADFIARLRLPSVGICFDSGHAYVAGQMHRLDLIAPFIISTHLHDNHGRSDEHLPPLSGDCNWKTVARALARADRADVLMLEVGPGDRATKNSNAGARRVRGLIGEARAALASSRRASPRRPSRRSAARTRV